MFFKICKTCPKSKRLSCLARFRAARCLGFWLKFCMADHGVHGTDTRALLGLMFFICLSTLRTVAFFIMSCPVSRANRFAFNPLALAALVSVLRGWQQISKASSPLLLALDSALPCWKYATSDAATDSVTCEDE